VSGRSGEEASLVVRTPSGERTLDGSHILVATGRIPNTAGIGLEEAGVELNERGYVRVNERLETSAPRSGRSANAPAARNSRISPRTTSASSGTILPAESAARTTG